VSLLSTLTHGASRLTRLAAGAALGLGLVASFAPEAAFAQAVEAPAAQAVTNATPALWVLRDADSTIYLFGTVHLMRPGVEWMTPQVTEAFNGSEELWLEIENPADQAAAAPLVMQLGISPQTPLSSLLTAEEFAELDRIARSLGMTGAMIDPYRPWLAALTLSVAPLQAAGYDPNAGIDMVLRGRAIEAGRPVRGLETMEQQFRFFAGMPEEDQLAFLRDALGSFDEAVTIVDQMAAHWSSGDPDALYAVGGAEMKTTYPALYDVILTNRNTDWANQIQTEMEGSGTVFIAVGALHLAGPDSVQAILDARGVTAERLQ
jgi:uncharacterized protein YbaP (TraB family)